MILIALGSNLSSRFGPPRATLEAALDRLVQRGVEVKRRSRWYTSRPVPVSDQPWFVNGVAEVESDRAPEALLALLHEIEAEFGRERRDKNEARVLDLDLLDYHGLVTDPRGRPALPHPRLAERAFVLLPLAGLAPEWRHPLSGRSAGELAATLPPGQEIEALA
ncbi:MAG: 2-amino-4-hydroxy-6-hydroxymethyldihydropteridine diphosphokinase [Kiloniellales bacterium]